MDGAKIYISRPGGASTHQICVYSGNNMCHCLTYQTVNNFDGLILYLYGPVEGRQLDSYMYRKSGIEYAISTAFFINYTKHYIYGDTAYVIRPWLRTKFLRSTETQGKKMQYCLMRPDHTYF